MQNNDYDRLKVQHKALLSLCKPPGASSANQDKLKKAADERQFCALCALSHPLIDALIKTYGLRERFFDLAPQPPAPGAAAAQDYLSQCERLLRSMASQTSLDDLRDRAQDAMLEFAAHFSGKLIHSSAQDGFLIAQGEEESTLPHVSSRSLWAAGVEVPLDQSKLDSTGFYQRVVRLLKARSDDSAMSDPPTTPGDRSDGDGINADDDAGDAALVDLSQHLPSEHVDAIILGARQGLEAARSNTPKKVDHRLRQVLLPSGDNYLAVSPLPAGGIAELWHTRAQADAERRNALLAEQAAKVVEKGAPEARQIGEGPSARNAKKTHPAHGSDKSPLRARAIFERMSLPFGGAIVRNASRFPKSVIQSQMYFHVPQRQEDKRAVWRFVFRSWMPRLPQRDALAVARQIEAIQQAFGNATSIGAVEAQSRGALARVALDCHNQVIVFSENVSNAVFAEGGEQIPVDADLLRKYRRETVGTLDLAIVNQAFNADYRAAMAQHLTQRLRAVMARVDGVNDPGMAARERVERAIERVLENA